MSTLMHCRTCRHHSMDKREKTVFEEGADGLEMLATHDGSEEDKARFGEHQFDDVFYCVKQGKEIGFNDDAGLGCPLWELGGKRKEVDARLEARMRELDEKAAREAEEK